MSVVINVYNSKVRSPKVPQQTGGDVLCYCPHECVIEPGASFKFNLGLNCIMPNGCYCLLTNYVDNLQWFEVSTVRYCNEDKEWFCYVTSRFKADLYLTPADVLCSINFVYNSRLPIGIDIDRALDEEEDNTLQFALSSSSSTECLFEVK